MATDTAGSTARNYHKQLVHYLRKTLAVADNGTQRTVGVLPAGAQILSPISGAYPGAVFDTTATAAVDIGTAASTQLLASALDVKTTGFKALDADSTNMIVDANTTVVATVTATTGDLANGQVELVIAYVPDNDG